MLAEKKHQIAYTKGPLQKNYDIVERLCAYISENWQSQPSLETMSRAIGFSPHHLHKVFSDWAGITPKEFIDALNIQAARKMLRQGESLLGTSHNLGLSGPARLHDLFIKKEAMTPGAYKVRGEGLLLQYGFLDTVFGRGLLIFNGEYLAGLAFCNGDDEIAAFEDMCRRWPKAQYVHAPDMITRNAQAIFSKRPKHEPLKVILIGSDFDIAVWEALIEIPEGSAVSYSNIADLIGKPKAARAVASAVGRNPISYVVPCHRVLRRGGMLGGYHWGLARKCAILGWEKAAKG